MSLAIKLVLLVAVVGGAAWYNQHTIAKGIEIQRAEDARILAEWQAKADAEAARLRKEAEEASHAHDQELADLQLYRDNHPLHGRLCPRPSTVAAAVPEATAPVAGDDGASPAARDFLAMPERDSGGSDQLGMLDILAGRADALSATLREYQARE